eukprot:205370_1
MQDQSQAFELVIEPGAILFYHTSIHRLDASADSITLDASADFAIKGATATKTAANTNWGTAYPARQVFTGKHEWKIKIVNGYSAMIGITTNVRISCGLCQRCEFIYYEKRMMIHPEMEM